MNASQPIVALLPVSPLNELMLKRLIIEYAEYLLLFARRYALFHAELGEFPSVQERRDHTHQEEQWLHEKALATKTLQHLQEMLVLVMDDPYQAVAFVQSITGTMGKEVYGKDYVYGDFVSQLRRRAEAK